MIKVKCQRCGRDDEYGGYALDEGMSLCVHCHAEYIRIKNSYHREITRFWDEKTTQSNKRNDNES